MELSDATEKIPSDTIGYRSLNHYATPGPIYVYILKLYLSLLLRLQLSSRHIAVLFVISQSPLMITHFHTNIYTHS
jgi:hypothetical protein